MEFISRLLLIYGVSFLLTYYGIMMYNKLKQKSDLLNNVIGGLAFGVIISFVAIIIHTSDILHMLNGRLMLVGFVSFLIGPLAGIISAALTSIVLAAFDHTNFLLILTVQLINVLLFGVARIIIAKRKRNPKTIEIFLFVGVINTIVEIIFLILEGNARIFEGGFSEFYLIAILEGVLFCGLFNVIYREQERDQYVQNLSNYSNELEQKSKKIESLYEEVSSNEEELRKNLEELTLYEGRIEYLAFHESQTGFYNHEKLIEQLREHQLAMKDPYGSMLIIGIVDVEKLERSLGIVLSDTLHYLAGIEIIAIFEEIAGAQLFSINKGKYAVLINNKYEKERIEESYKQLKRRFLESFILNTIELKVNIAAGGLEFSNEIQKPEQYLERCEFALYNAAADDSADAKIVWFGEELMALHAKELKIGKELYKALENNELYLMYQPQFNNECKMIGAEALLRWKHSDMGEIPPGIFIPIAVRNGLIDSVGKMVVNSACSFINKNRDKLVIEADVIPISVNASFIELINPNFSQRFLDVMNKYQIAPELIRIEVTESEISMHYSELEENLRQLREANISVELDDFGTGYSSLNHLGNMPVHTIKIDKVFVDKILIDNKIGDLVEMIIDFAHRFRMRIIAEGVETQEQFLWLKHHNCDAYQGYYFAKPLREEIFLDQLQDKR